MSRSRSFAIALTAWVLFAAPRSDAFGDSSIPSYRFRHSANAPEVRWKRRGVWSLCAAVGGADLVPGDALETVYRCPVDESRAARVRAYVVANGRSVIEEIHGAFDITIEDRLRGGASEGRSELWGLLDDGSLAGCWLWTRGALRSVCPEPLPQAEWGGYVEQTMSLLLDGDRLLIVRRVVSDTMNERRTCYGWGAAGRPRFEETSCP